MCIFPWEHTYGKWQVVEESNLTRRGTDSVIGKCVIQRRECKKCGFRQHEQQIMKIY